jgi:hypothetical protein
MRNLGYFAAIAVLVTSQAVAETAPAPAQGPAPLTRRIPCDAFRKQEDGAWVPIRDVNVQLPDGNVLTVGPAASFPPGQSIRGLDLGATLERECRSG